MTNSSTTNLLRKWLFSVSHINPGLAPPNGLPWSGANRDPHILSVEQETGGTPCR